MASVARYCCCVCEESANACSFCTDITYSKYAITFSGVSLCADCRFGGTQRFTWNTGFSDDSLNTTHILPQVSGAYCDWLKILVNAITHTTYNNNGCAGGVASTTNINLAIALTRRSGEWSVDVFLQTASIQPLFLDTQPETAAGICETLPSFTNDNTTCFGLTGPPTFREQLGTGGTATVVCA